MKDLYDIHEDFTNKYEAFKFSKDIKRQHLPCENLRIMMIDDSVKDIELFEELLSVEGNIKFSLSKWTKCHEALNYLENERIQYRQPPPHLIVLDLMMPEMNGKMVLKRLKGITQTKSIPIVIYSSMNNYKNIMDIRGLEATAFFQKPLNVEEFVSFLQD